MSDFVPTEAEAKPKLTPEEKKALKLEKKRQKQAAKEAFLLRLRKQDLDKEVGISKKVSKKLGMKWKKLCIKTNVNTDVRDIMYETWNLFQGAVAKKDLLISELLNRWDQNQILREKQFQSNVLLSDTLITDFKRQLADTKSEYDKMRRKSLNNRLYHVETRRLYEENVEDQLKTIVHLNNNNLREGLLLKCGDYFTRLDVEMNRLHDGIITVSSLLEAKSQLIWDEYKKVLYDYTTDTETTMRKIKEIMPRDTASLTIIREQFVKLQDLHKKIEKYNRILQMEGANAQQRKTLEELRTEKIILVGKESETRNQLIKDKKLSENLLKVLVRNSNKAIDRLSGLGDKGDKIIRLTDMCHAYQTHDEYHGGMSTTEPKKRASLMSYKKGSTDPMMKFWKRVGRPELHSIELSEERKYLIRENKKMEKHLKMILGLGASSNDHIQVLL